MWNVRFNGTLIGRFSDSESATMSKQLESATRNGTGIVFRGRIDGTGDEVTAYWTPGCPISFEKV